MHYYPDIEEIALANEEKIIRHFAPDGTWSGQEYDALNPSRPDKTAGAFKYNKAKHCWSDFATGKQGRGPISYAACCLDVDCKEVIPAVATFLGIQPGEQKSSSCNNNSLQNGDQAALVIPAGSEPESDARQCTQITPVSPDAPQTPLTHSLLKGPSFVFQYDYNNESGQLPLYVYRIKPEGWDSGNANKAGWTTNKTLNYISKKLVSDKAKTESENKSPTEPKDAAASDPKTTPIWNYAETRLLITKLLSTEPQPFEFIIPGLLPKGIVGFLFGEGGSNKSLAALELGMQRAAGYVINTKWLDRFEISGAGRSLFCSVEDQIIDVHHRTRAIINWLAEVRSDVPRESIENAIEENCHVIPREWWLKGGLEHIIDEEGQPTIMVDHVVNYTIEQKIDLIILDTLSRISLLDENDNNAGARLISILEQIRDRTDATVLVIAHTGKQGRIAKTDTNGQNGLRGASSLMDNARFGLWFRSLPQKNGRSIIEVTNAKTYRTRRVAPFKVAVDFPTFTLYNEDEEDDDDLMDTVVNEVKAHPGTTQRATRKRLRKGSKQVKLGFEDALDEHLIRYKGKGQGYEPCV